MQNLDGSAVTTALPSMARDLGEEPARLGAAITAYLVALTVFIPVSGWVADRFGAKRVFMAAICVFVLASLLCARRDNLLELVAARSLQGLGGAMMVPVARLLLLRQVRKDEMLSAMAWLTMPAMLGPVSGPPLGGLLTDAFGWHAVFLINLPIGALGLALVAWKIPPTPARDPGPPDLPGLALVGSALALLMFGLETAGRGVVPRPVPEAALVLGLLAGWAALRHCRRTARPALDLSLLQVRTFKQGALAGSLFRVGAGATPFLVPLLLQVGFGKSASQAGLVSFATALGAFAMKPLARPVLRRFGFRRALVGGALLSAAGVAVLAALVSGVAARRDLRRAGGGRAVPLLAVQRPERAGLRRPAGSAALRRHQPVRHGAAIGAGAGRGAGDRGAGGERPPRGADGPGRAGLRRGLPGGGCDDRGIGAVPRASGAGRRGGGERPRSHPPPGLSAPFINSK